MPVKISKSLPQINNRRVAHYKNNAVVTLNNLNREQLEVYKVKLWHKYKVVKCRFFVAQDDSPTLLGMLDIEVLGMLKIMCKVVNVLQAGRKFNSQIT